MKWWAAPVETNANGMRTQTYIINDDLTGEQALKLADCMASIPFDDVDVVVLSLKGSSAVDASGLAVLVRLYSRLMRAQKFLILRDVAPEVESVLREVGLSSVFAGLASEKSAPTPIVPRKRKQPVVVSAREVTIAPENPAGDNPTPDTPTLEQLAEALGKLALSQAVELLQTVVKRHGIKPEELFPKKLPQNLPRRVTRNVPDPRSAGRSRGQRPRASHQAEVHWSAAETPERAGQVVKVLPMSRPHTPGEVPLPTVRGPNVLRVTPERKTQAQILKGARRVKRLSGPIAASRHWVQRSHAVPNRVRPSDTAEVGDWAWRDATDSNHQRPASTARAPLPLPPDVETLLLDYLAVETSQLSVWDSRF